MQWSLEPAAGFTKGVPWEPLHPDSFTANVQALDADPGSLLNLYRLLIHLRAENEALGAGELIPLDAGRESVAAYLRRGGDRVVLVVANLGNTPLTGVTLSSAARVLPAGRYDPVALVGGAEATALQIRADGRLRNYAPLVTLAPLTAYVFEISSGG
jgi:glycosidase